MDSTTPHDDRPDKAAELDFLGPPRRAGERGTLGPYRVTDVLGRGGMGMVLRASTPP